MEPARVTYIRPEAGKQQNLPHVHLQERTSHTQQHAQWPAWTWKHPRVIISQIGTLRGGTVRPILRTNSFQHPIWRMAILILLHNVSTCHLCASGYALVHLHGICMSQPTF
jgi:hypothetical protein